MSNLWQLNLYEKVFILFCESTLISILYFVQISFTIERPIPNPPELIFSLEYLLKIALSSIIFVPKEKKYRVLFSKEIFITLFEKEYFIAFDRLLSITSPINNLNYGIILYGKNRCKKIITQRVV